MKKNLLVFVLFLGISIGVSAQVTNPPTPPVLPEDPTCPTCPPKPDDPSIIERNIVVFGDGIMFGELEFNKATDSFLKGWVSYPALGHTGVFFKLPVNTVLGGLVYRLVGPDNTTAKPDFFQGTIFYGNIYEGGSLYLHEGNSFMADF